MYQNCVANCLWPSAARSARCPVLRHFRTVASVALTQCHMLVAVLGLVGALQWCTVHSAAHGSYDCFTGRAPQMDVVGNEFVLNVREQQKMTHRPSLSVRVWCAVSNKK